MRKLGAPKLPRTAEYCSDRARELFKDYRVNKNKQPPSMKEQSPDATEEEILLANIEASAEEDQLKSETQEEQAIHELALK